MFCIVSQLSLAILSLPQQPPNYNTQPTDQWQKLPNDVAREIFSKLDDPALRAISSTNRALNRLSKDPELRANALLKSHGKEAGKIAAHRGVTELGVYDRLHAKGANPTATLMGASEKGQVEVLRNLNTRIKPDDATKRDMIFEAAKNRHPKTTGFILDKMNPNARVMQSGLLAAAAEDNLDMVKVIDQRIKPAEKQVAYATVARTAAEADAAKTIDFMMKEKRVSVFEINEAYSAAARRNRRARMRQMMNQNQPIHPDQHGALIAIEEAISNGYFEAAQDVVREHGTQAVADRALTEAAGVVGRATDQALQFMEFLLFRAQIKPSFSAKRYALSATASRNWIEAVRILISVMDRININAVKQQLEQSGNAQAVQIIARALKPSAKKGRFIIYE